MIQFDRHNRNALAEARVHLRPPVRRRLTLGHLLLAAGFAAIAALISAAAVILGVPGLDDSALKAETSAWGVIKAPAIKPPPAPSGPIAEPRRTRRP